MFRNGKVLAVIPARGGSKGLPGKNIKHANGKPLIWFSHDSALKSHFIDDVILSSDSSEIIDAAKVFGLHAPFKRPDHLATDTADSISVMLHAWTHYPDYKYVVLLQPTSPLRTSQDIDACFHKMNKCDAPACITVVQAKQHPAWMVSIKSDEKIRSVLDPSTISTRRQDLNEAYILNGAVYVAEFSWLAHSKSFLNKDVVASVMPPERSLDIDSEFDFKIFKALIS